MSAANLSGGNLGAGEKSAVPANRSFGTRPKPEPGTPEYQALGMSVYLLLGEPLIFDPEPPDAFLEDLAWRYRVLIRQPAGPVPITQLLSSSEIQDVKAIVTADEGAQQHIREIWAKRVRGDRSRGGEKSARRLGIEAWVVSRVCSKTPPPISPPRWLARTASATSSIVTGRSSSKRGIETFRCDPFFPKPSARTTSARHFVRSRSTSSIRRPSR